MKQTLASLAIVTLVNAQSIYDTVDDIMTKYSFGISTVGLNFQEA